MIVAGLDDALEDVEWPLLIGDLNLSRVTMGRSLPVHDKGQLVSSGSHQQPLTQTLANFTQLQSA